MGSRGNRSRSCYAWTTYQHDPPWSYWIPTKRKTQIKYHCHWSCTISHQYFEKERRSWQICWVLWAWCESAIDFRPSNNRQYGSLIWCYCWVFSSWFSNNSILAYDKPKCLEDVGNRKVAQRVRLFERFHWKLQLKWDDKIQWSDRTWSINYWTLHFWPKKTSR